VTVLRRLETLVWFVARVIGRLRGIDIGRSAGSLAFTTLLGVVPLFTVAFTYVARFPLFQSWMDGLEPFLLKFLLPGAGATVRQYMVEFIAKAATLKGTSIAFVVLTALLLVAEVESEINKIWGTDEPRSMLRRVVVYALGVTAVPALIASAAYITTLLMQEAVAAVPIAAGVVPWLTRPFEWAISGLALTLLYWLVPAQRVRFVHALAGGILSAIAFESAKYGFRWYIVRAPTYEIVYGALAAVPLFLLWIYLTWIIVLVGAAVTATLAEPGRPGGPRRRR
jgi:membrane protein